MGLAKSFRKAGNLDRFSQGLQEIGNMLKRNKDQGDQDQYNQLMTTAMDSLRKTYSTQPEDNVSWNSDSPLPPPQTELGKRIKPPGSTKMDMSDDPGNITGAQTPFKDPNLNIEDPDFEILGDVSGRKYGNSEDQQRMEQQRVMAEFMQRAGKLKGVDTAKLNQGMETLKLTAGGYTPTTKKQEHFQLDPEKPTYTTDSFGNLQLLIPGKEKPGSVKSLGSYTGDDGFEYTKIIGNDGIITEVKSQHKVKPPKGTVINIKPPKSEKWNDFGAYINSIDYKQDPTTGAIVPNTPEERKIKREFAKNTAIGNMLPRAINWYNTEIKTKWNAENISQADFEMEIQESYSNGELTADEAQDLLDLNQYRPFLYDVIRPSARRQEGDNNE